MKKVFKFVKGRREAGLTPSSSGDLLTPANTPEDERFLGLDSSSGYIVDFCGKDKTLTKLHKAAWQGNLDKLKVALKKIDIDAVDRHNRTPLHFAVAQGHPNIVWFLLGNNARHTICDSEGCTPLLKAVESCHKECMTLLLERGANVNHSDFTGRTPLHIAVKIGALEVTTTLLEKGADAGMANNGGDQPLHVAIKAQNKDMVQVLLRHAAPVNAVDRENRTPLMLAAKSGNLVLAQLFFEYGAQLFVTDSNGWTAEDYALLGGHQNVASELKLHMKKESSTILESHPEEDESVRSEADTWNDSNQSDTDKKVGENKVGEFLRKFTEVSKKDKNEKEDELIAESPGSGVVPPPCQPPRSWEIIEAGMIDEATADGAEPKRRSITALGSLHSRRESFTEHYADPTKYTLSLNRRRDSKKDRSKINHRFSFNEEETLKSSLTGEFSIIGSDKSDIVKSRKKEDSVLNECVESDWDSNLSSLLENSSAKVEKPVKALKLPCDQDGTLGRTKPLNEVEEWTSNDQQPFPDPPSFLPTKVDEEESSWDSGESFHEGAFPPPPTAIELGVDMAQSRSYLKGVSIDHAPSRIEEETVWHKAYEQSQSLDCLDEKDESKCSLPGGKHHSRNPSISSQKWKSAELPSQQPSGRHVESNKRINDQLKCYDQALRELAQSSYAKKQDAIVLGPVDTQVSNYYSLPSSKIIRPDKEFSLTGKTKASPREYAMSLPLHFKRQHAKIEDVVDGPSSIPFSVNYSSSTRNEEVENNERLGCEEGTRLVKPKNLDLGTPLGPGVDNLESPMSDDMTGSDKSDQKSKRHMLLAMRDVKHAVQVTHSFKTSMDDHILSPLTKTEDHFDLSPSKITAVASGGTSPIEEKLYFLGETQGELGRQETVIERVKSSPSDSGDESTLWLQDKLQKGAHHSSFSSEEGGRKKSSSSADSSPLSNKGKARRTPSSAFRRLQKLGSSSDNEESVRERTEVVAGVGDVVPADVSPDEDISLSSGPIDPLNNKDSGSDGDSSAGHTTPVKHYSLKKHHKWLKERLLTENKDRQKLEEVSAQLTERAERLQYELEDAKEATKSRDEIISLLQGQLNRMETAYTKSLEESVHCRLQLTTLEQEMYHLRELCSQYEEERDGTRVNYTNDSPSALLVNKIRQLEEERENLCREVVRLEQNKLCKGGDIQETGEAREAEEDQWKGKERCDTSEEPCQLVQNGSMPSSNASSLQRRNVELQSQIILANEINKRLEDKLDKIITINQMPMNDEINQSIMTLSRKNAAMEKQLKNLIQKLNEKSTSRTYDDQILIDRLNDEKVLLVKTYEKRLADANSEVIESFKKENQLLTQTIRQLQDEIYRLIQEPKEKNHRLKQDEHDKVTEEVENKEVPDVELRKKVEIVQSLEQKAKSPGGTLEKRPAREDELAWCSLYGMGSTRKSKTSPITVQADKDSEEFIEQKVKELERELQKAKDEIHRQRTESAISMKTLLPTTVQSPQVVSLKRKIVQLESDALCNNALRMSLQAKTAEMAVGLQERQELEFQFNDLKMRMQREFLPKVDAEVAKFQADLLSRTVAETSGSARLIENGLRERLEGLAKERDKAEAVRRRLGRQCVSWEAGFAGQPSTTVPFRSLPRDRLLTEKPPLPIVSSMLKRNE